MSNSFLESLFSLKDKVALIVGGGGELGKSMALGIAKAGADVVIADIKAQAANEVSEEIAALGRKSAGFQVDVTDSKKVDQMVDEVIDQFSKIDILVNSAGISRHIPAHEMTDEDWETVVKINLNGTFFCCRAVGKYMIKQGKGSIINIASMSGSITNKDSFNASYCASKGGVKMLSKQLAEQWARYNIRINSISPGYMRTQLAISYIDDPKNKKWIEMVSPMKRAGMPDELMGLAIYLASDASSFVTGEDVIIDGGWTIV